MKPGVDVGASQAPDGFVVVSIDWPENARETMDPQQVEVSASGISLMVSDDLALETFAALGSYLGDRGLITYKWKRR